MRTKNIRICSHVHEYWTVFLGLLAASLLQGCGEGKPWVDTSLTEATVSGTVSVKGTPATGGKILFNPSNAGRIVPSRIAEIAPDGSYTIKTLTGDNRVTFEGEVATKNVGVGLIKEYAKVESGENHADFDLLGEGSKKIQYELTKKGKAKGRR
jgi:hypothetical protein